jgi:hypothetical protein
MKNPIHMVQIKKPFHFQQRHTVRMDGSTTDPRYTAESNTVGMNMTPR